ncbi:DEAD/DEAH box helicase [Marinilabiliaceae bacterium JC017]|nr:DEAD/DEAH box helicase [Marinilabiliaceae bacterium JC017]
MGNSSIQEYISDYINFYASKDVITRGKAIYKKGNVLLNLYAEDIDTWIFSVKGSNQYKVHIRNLKKLDIDTSCSCPFIWGSLCKHTVAALLYISDLDGDPDNRNSIKSGGQKRSVLGYELDDFELITEELIKNNSTSNAFNDVNWGFRYFTVDSTTIESQKIVFDVQHEYEKHKVTFLFKDDKVYVSSTYRRKTVKLNNLEALCLSKIAESTSPDLFDLVFNNKLQTTTAKVMEVYGFDKEDDFNKYFTIGFYENEGLIIDLLPQFQGLLPVDEVAAAPFVKFIDNINGATNVVEGLEQGKEQRELGFLLDFNRLNLDHNPYYDIESDEIFYPNIIPIIGKPNKAKTVLASHIAEYGAFEDEYYINLSDNSREILRLIKQVDAEVSAKQVYRLHKRLMTLLVQESYVYIRKKLDYKIRKSDLVKINVSAQLLDAFYEVKEDNAFVHLDLKLKIGEDIIKSTQLNRKQSGNFIYSFENTLYAVKNYNVGMLLSNYTEDIKMAKAHKEQLFQHVIKPLSKNFDIEFNQGVYDVETVELDFNKKQVFLTEKDEHLIISPQVEYHQGVSVHLGTSGNVLVEEEEGIIEYKRNFELEEDFAEFIAALHPNFQSQNSDKNFYLHYTEFTHDMWFYKFFDALQANDVEVYGLKELKSFKYSPYKGKISTSVSSGQDWFEVDVKVSFGDNQVKLKDIRKAVLNNQKYIQLKDGSVGVLPNEWFHKLEKYFRHGEVRDDKLSVSKLRFSIIDELFDNIDDAQIMQEIAGKRKRLEAFTEISQTSIPEEIKADLRPYQKEGLNWLNFLDEMGWGGILADDMGLGKTLQVLTFIQHIIKKNKTTNLIIVPTTLLFNWENEINKFAPGLKALYHYGINRAKEPDVFSDYHLVFTTYGILLRDIEMLSQYQFNYVILDESQAIKNPASRRFKAANLLKANNRIAMSGTPIENSTFDLFAQMSFVNQGFLGGVTAFKDNFSNAIDKDGDEMIAAELQRLINPFILRRTKEKVAGELPPKTEDVIYCEMDSAQRKVYDAYRNNYRDQLLGKIEADGMGKSKMMVLEALTRLRQICDSPVLLNDEKISERESVKIKEIVQHITDKTANHKILIFSQFVKMLTLVKEELVKRNIEFEYLDGKSTTTQREQSVKNFQENNDLRVFLISLKAGGTGLNLTAADYVYIIDPWWNPAVENQAIDRCYRIGQDKTVFAYRMICKNTVEEKILKLQNKKKKIAGDIVQTDENIMKTLEADDIRELFS